MSIDVQFLGTGSAAPQPNRGVSAISVRFCADGFIWLFDCGEGTQIQILRTQGIRMGKISKIFITHLHGDHLFGLPGLLCTLNKCTETVAENTCNTDNQDDGVKVEDGSSSQQQSKQKLQSVLEVYGPRGLRRFLRQALQLSRSELAYKYVVHELVPCEEQMPDNWECWTYEEDDRSPLHPNEVMGRNMRAADGEDGPVWTVCESAQATVRATWLAHRVPCFAYVLQEPHRPGRLNVDALRADSVPQGPLWARIKRGEVVTLDDGTQVDGSKYIGESRQGRKLAILGDTCGYSGSFVRLASHCDLLIHEATLQDDMRDKAIQNGHSTPVMAADCAINVACRHLVLTHVSQRYRVNTTNDQQQNNDVGIGVQEHKCKEDNMILGDVSRLLKEAEEHLAERQRRCDSVTPFKITLAYDFTTVSLPYRS